MTGREMPCTALLSFLMVLWSWILGFGGRLPKKTGMLFSVEEMFSAWSWSEEEKAENNSEDNETFPSSWFNEHGWGLTLLRHVMESSH